MSVLRLLMKPNYVEEKNEGIRPFLRASLTTHQASSEDMAWSGPWAKHRQGLHEKAISWSNLETEPGEALDVGAVTTELYKQRWLRW